MHKIICRVGAKTRDPNVRRSREEPFHPAPMILETRSLLLFSTDEIFSAGVKNDSAVLRPICANRHYAAAFVPSINLLDNGICPRFDIIRDRAPTRDESRIKGYLLSFFGGCPYLLMRNVADFICGVLANEIKNSLR